MMTDDEEKQWRKQQIRMHALQMAVMSLSTLDTGAQSDVVVSVASKYENYIFRSTREGEAG